MNDEQHTFSRHFTLAEANAALPLVRAIVKDLARTSREVIERRERLSLLRANHQQERDDVYSQELGQIELDLQNDATELRNYVEELRQIGVETKGPLDGLVDFPARHEGRTVFLCWKLGEPEVSHWHEIDAGFAGRHPVDDILFDESLHRSDTSDPAPVDG